MDCPHCHEPCTPRAKFCPACGARLSPVCAACGADLPEQARFCPACGAPVGPAADRAPTRHATAEGPPAPRTPVGYTPRHLAEKILVSRTALQGERKPVTVLFCDLVGSTALAERLGSDAMHDLLNRFFEAALAEVHRYEGTINQFLGDGFMALFGAPIAHEDHARRAALAALGIARVLGERPVELESGERIALDVRMGLNTGVVVVGAIGDNLRMDYTAVGDTTHLASRLQQLAAPGAILTTEATARLIEGYVALERSGPTEIRGLSAPVTVYRVTGPGPRRSRLEVASAGALTRFVGRERELAVLRSLLADAAVGRGCVVGIVGEPGVGKSRLLLEIRLALDAGGVGSLEGRCLSYGATIPYLPVLDLVRAACAISDVDAPERVAAAVRSYVDRAGLDIDTYAPYLLHVLGMKADDGALAALEGEVVMARTFAALRQICLRGRENRPHVLIVEDLHWIDRTSEAFLTSLVDALVAAPVLLICTYRPGYRPAWMDRSYATQIALSPLGRDESLAVVHSVLPELPAGDPLAQVLLDKAEGNPFFLEELARALGDETGSARALVVPDTVHGVLVARIDRLPESAKHLLQTASVLGREFSRRLLASLAPAPDALAPDLAELVRLEFLYQRAAAEEPVYAFKHALTQDVAYATLVTSQRRALHRRAAAALQALDPQRLHELAPVLAHHYVEAEAWAEAVVHARRAAEQAQRGYANREARAGFTRALDAAARAGLGESVRIELLEARAGVHTALGDFEGARGDLETAARLAEDIGDAAAQGRALGALGALWGGHRDYQRGLELTRRAVALTGASGDGRALAEARGRLGIILLNLTRMRESRAELESALALFSELGDELGQARTMEMLAMNAWIGGDLDRAISLARDAVPRLQRLGDRAGEISALAVQGGARALRTGWSTAEPLCRQALDAAVAIGAPNAEAFVRILVSDFSIYSGRYGLAHREGSEGLRIAEAIGHLEWTTYALGVLGRLHAECGQLDVARRQHERMLATSRELNTGLWIAGALASLGGDLLLLGDRDGARRHLTEAFEVGGEAIESFVRASVHLGDLEIECGRPEAALDTVRRFTAVGGAFRVVMLDMRRIEAEAHAQQGEGAGAQAALRALAEEAVSLDAAPPAWRAHLARARLLRSQGQTDEAGAAARAALALLERSLAELPDDLRRSFETIPPVREARALLR